MVQNRKFFINSTATFFDDKIDKANRWETIVFDPVSLNYIRINPTGYKILRIIDENPGINFFELVFKTKKSEKTLQEFLETVIGENIVFVQ